MNRKISKALVWHPVTPDRWADFEALFGERGACGGCWCMWWRISRSQFEQQKGLNNKLAMQEMVIAGKIPGILVYDGGHAVGWCSVARREEFLVLQRSRILKPVDEQPVWSVVCFFVAKGFRRQGMSVRLLQSAIDHVKKQGGRMVEGHPVDPKKPTMPAVFAFTGLRAAFVKAGFQEVLRRSETRPIMRFEIK